MKKYIFYIAIIAILVTIALVLIFNDKPGTITGSEKNFALSDTSHITKIRYIRNGEVMELSKMSSVWVVNKKYPAKIQLVNATLKFLQQFNVISAVPKDGLNKAVEALNEKSLQVTVEGAGKIVTQYRFCEIDTAPAKVFIIMEGSSKPYIANLTGYDIPLFTLFPTNEMMWRDRKIFRSTIADMMMVGLAYPKNPEKSFSLMKMEGSYQLKSGDETVKNPSKEAITNYLMNINSLQIDRFASGPADITYKQVQAEIPMAELIVKNTDNSMETLKIYQLKMKDNHNEKDNPDMLIATVGTDTIPVMIKAIDFDPLLKSKGDFVGK